MKTSGTARFTGVDKLEVGAETLTARYFVIASGAEPAPLGIPGQDQIITSDDFLDLESLPTRIAFVGGGYIAFEFAHLSRQAGSNVTILHRGKRPLEQFDADITDQLLAHTRRIGIDISTQHAGERISGSPGETGGPLFRKKVFRGSCGTRCGPEPACERAGPACRKYRELAQRRDGQRVLTKRIESACICRR